MIIYAITHAVVCRKMIIIYYACIFNVAQYIYKLKVLDLIMSIALCLHNRGCGYAQQLFHVNVQYNKLSVMLHDCKIMCCF